MDDYSRKTIDLLLKHDKKYLVEIIQKQLDINVQDNAVLTTESVCELFRTQEIQKIKPHMSSIFVCKCGSKHVTIREIQLRSADEGSTIKHICNKCGYTW